MDEGFFFIEKTIEDLSRQKFGKGGFHLLIASWLAPSPSYLFEVIGGREMEDGIVVLLLLEQASRVIKTIDSRMKLVSIADLIELISLVNFAVDERLKNRLVLRVKELIPCGCL